MAADADHGIQLFCASGTFSELSSENQWPRKAVVPGAESNHRHRDFQSVRGEFYRYPLKSKPLYFQGNRVAGRSHKIKIFLMELVQPYTGITPALDARDRLSHPFMNATLREVYRLESVMRNPSRTISYTLVGATLVAAAAESDPELCAFDRVTRVVACPEFGPRFRMFHTDMLRLRYAQYRVQCPR